MCYTVEKWLMGIFCLGVRSLNIHQELLSSVCRLVSTWGDLPLLLSYSCTGTVRVFWLQCQTRRCACM